MASIRVFILDPTGSRKTEVEVPDDVPVGRLTKALINRMQFPGNDQSGAPITYRLSSQDGNALSDATTFHEAGVKEGEILRLTAEMQAGCFLAGTMIAMAYGSSLPIEALYPGAEVLSYDLRCKRICSGTVAKLTNTRTTEYVVINDLIRVSLSHLLYADNRWQPAKDLVTGQSLLSRTGRPRRVERIQRCTREVTVYNLHLSNHEHTFFAEEALVHNQDVKTAYSTLKLNKLIAHLIRNIGASDRRQFVEEIADALEARLKVSILSQIDTSQKEREEVRGTMLVKPVFGLPAIGHEFHCDVFMIMPFSSQFQSIYDDYIRPIVTSLSLKITRSDDLFTTRNVMDDIWSAIARTRFIMRIVPDAMQMYSMNLGLLIP